jgi:hypothetical protein
VSAIYSQVSKHKQLAKFPNAGEYAHLPVAGSIYAYRTSQLVMVMKQMSSSRTAAKETTFFFKEERPEGENLL